MTESSVQAQEAGGSSQHNNVRNRSSVHSQNSSDLDNTISVKKSSVCIQETTVTRKEDRINRKEISKETSDSSLNEIRKTTSGHLMNKARKQNSKQIKSSGNCNKQDGMVVRRENFNQTLDASSVLENNDVISGKGHSDHDQKTSEFYRSNENNQGTRKSVEAKESAIQHKDNKEVMQNGDEGMYIPDSSDVNLIEQQNGKKIQDNKGSANYCNETHIAVKNESTRL